MQTGDPTGTGKGGNSIWGNRFEDEFKDELKVKRCFNMLLIIKSAFKYLF